MSAKSKKIRRYHTDVFVPEWYEKSAEEFLSALNTGNSLVFTFHALEKITEYSSEYGKILVKYIKKSVREVPLQKESVFEFYANKEGIIKKACFRFSFEDFPVDLVFVIAQDSTVITLYTTSKGDNHSTLDKRLYEKE